jgi:hypothetical protein
MNASRIDKLRALGQRLVLLELLIVAETVELIPAVYTPNAHLSDEINRNIIQSEIEGGVFLYNLPQGAVLEIETQNRIYKLVSCGDGDALLSGHPTFCPEPAPVRIQGSTWGGAMLKHRFIGRGMHLEFSHPAYKGPILTSRIVDIRTTDTPPKAN